MLSKFANSTRVLKKTRTTLKRFGSPIYFRITKTQGRNFHKFSTKETKTTFSKNQKLNNLLRKYQHQKQQYRNYQSSGSKAIPGNSPMMGYIGIIALIGGGYILLNTLNMPKVVESTSVNYLGDPTTTLVEKPSIPAHVREYLVKVYQYVACGIGLTGASAVVAFRSGIAHKMLTSNSMVASIGLMIGTIGSMIICNSISPNNTVAKWGSFALFNGMMGVSLCTLAFIAPHVLLRAGVYTMGIFGALSFTAMNAKEDKFLFLGGPLLAGLGVLILSSFVGMFLPARFIRTLSIIEKFSLYGGLAIFCGFLLYDTQRLMQKAKFRKNMERDNYKLPPVDYMRDSISIYIDLVNIFVRMVAMLSGSKRK